MTNALEQTKSLPPDQLKQHASKIYDSVIPLVQHDPLFHIWNECKQRKASGDPEAKYIVRMVNSRTRPLTHFFGSAIENFYGGGTSVRGSA